MTMNSTVTSISATGLLTNQQLEQAFAVFNRVSDELGCAWRELEGRVAHLSNELAATRSARFAELAEKKRIADKLSTLMEALPGAVVVISAAGRVEDSNPAAQAIFGGGLQGCPWSQVLAACTDTPLQVDGEFDSHDQRRFVVAYSQLADAKTRIALLTDITESHRLSQLLHREQRLRDLGDMAARLAHQLRTPLSSAMLYLAQLGSSAASNTGAVSGDAFASTADQHAARVGRKVQERLRQIERLIEGMLRFIQGAANPLEPLCLKQLVVDNCAAMQPQFEHVDAELELDLPSGEFHLRGQREALDNALSNLLDNALQSCTGKPHIRVSLQHSRDAGADSVELCVSDNGPGIDDSIQGKIFDPWFSTRQHGTGLGLAVVASAARAHGGEVVVTKSVAGGSSFCLRLPLVQQEINDEELA